MHPSEKGKKGMWWRAGKLREFKRDALFSAAQEEAKTPLENRVQL